MYFEEALKLYRGLENQEGAYIKYLDDKEEFELYIDFDYESVSMHAIRVEGINDTISFISKLPVDYLFKDNWMIVKETERKKVKIKFNWGDTLEDCYQKLIENKLIDPKRLYYGDFNKTEINSDMDIDEVYMLVMGKTKKEHDRDYGTMMQRIRDANYDTERTI